MSLDDASRVDGVSPDGNVSVVVLDGRLRSVEISASMLRYESRYDLEQAIIGAVNAALDSLDERTADEVDEFFRANPEQADIAALRNEVAQLMEALRP